MDDFYLVRSAQDNADLWVAVATADKLLAYVQNTGKFHEIPSLEMDFYVDGELAYDPITPAEARALLDAGSIGLLDERLQKPRLDRYYADETAIDPSAVFEA